LQWIDNSDENSDVLKTMGSENVSSDFGRRECCNNKWHDRIDVTDGGNDLGFKIKSIASGTVTKINDSQYKVLIIQGDSDRAHFGDGMGSLNSLFHLHWF